MKVEKYIDRWYLEPENRDRVDYDFLHEQFPEMKGWSIALPRKKKGEK